MDALHIAGDVAWIAALSIMAGGSRHVARIIPRQTRVPLWLGARAPRNVALAANPALALAAGLALLWANTRYAPMGPDWALIMFALRATLAALAALAHLHWIRAITAQLHHEGALKP